MKVFSFEDLTVWKDSKELTKVIYSITSSFPDNEKFGLVSQMRRASISVSSNIAEGSSRVSPKDQAHFYHLSYSSLMEVFSQFLVSKELGLIADMKENNIRDKVSKISYKLNSLRTSALERQRDENKKKS
jgi:four helix bundle protein